MKYIVTNFGKGHSVQTSAGSIPLGRNQTIIMTDDTAQDKEILDCLRQTPCVDVAPDKWELCRCGEYKSPGAKLCADCRAIENEKEKRKWATTPQ